MKMRKAAKKHYKHFSHKKAPKSQNKLSFKREARILHHLRLLCFFVAEMLLCLLAADHRPLARKTYSFAVARLR